MVVLLHGLKQQDDLFLLLSRTFILTHKQIYLQLVVVIYISRIIASYTLNYLKLYEISISTFYSDNIFLFFTKNNENLLRLPKNTA